MELYADNDAGIIKLDDTTLKGILQSLSINGEIIVDSSNGAADNNTTKVMRGYKDKTVSISLKIIPTEDKTVYDILEELEEIFKNEEDQTPKVYTLLNKHTVARGIDRVLFTSLSSSEDNTQESISVSLNFEEFVAAKYTEA